MAVFYLNASPFQPPVPSSSPRPCHRAVSPLELFLRFSSSALAFLCPLLMAPPQPLTILDPYAWERSSVTRLALGELVAAG
jgi:hypothetical protein